MQCTLESKCRTFTNVSPTSACNKMCSLDLPDPILIGATRVWRTRLPNGFLTHAERCVALPSAVFTLSHMLTDKVVIAAATVGGLA